MDEKSKPEEKKRIRRQGPKIPNEKLRAILYDARFTKLTLKDIAQKHGVKSYNVCRWVKTFSSEFSDMATIKPIQTEEPTSDTTGIMGREKSLQKELEEAKMKIICLETMIDIAQKEFKVDIRKNFGTKQSNL